MITYQKHTLDNGLRLIIHTDKSTPLAAIDLTYGVGTRDEHPERTGLAHLLEHLMFGGSEQAPDFDMALQMAGGDNNAFTNSDFTSYFESIPAENLATALWLEADRMRAPVFTEEGLDNERRVVVEEFKETCLNEPYGDALHLLLPLAYRKHPYRYPVLGSSMEHVSSTTLEEVRRFHKQYYHPGNAVLAIASPLPAEVVISIVNLYFGDIPAGPSCQKKEYPIEPVQKAYRHLTHQGDVPVDAFWLAFPMPSRREYSYYVGNLLSDLLCDGPSSRLYLRLLKDRKLLTQIDCYTSDTVDPGLFIIEGRPAKGVTLDQAVQAVWEELDVLRNELPSPHEMDKIRHRVATDLTFAELTVKDKASSLAYYEMLGDLDLINREDAIYKKVSAQEIQEYARTWLIRERCNQLDYRKKSKVPISSTSA